MLSDLLGSWKYAPHFWHFRPMTQVYLPHLGHFAREPPSGFPLAASWWSLRASSAEAVNPSSHSGQ